MWGGLNDRPALPGWDPTAHPHGRRWPGSPTSRSAASSSELKDDGLLDETLIVLTTDHAQQTSKYFYGVDGFAPGRGNLNWYYGADADETYLDPQPEIQRLVDETGNVEMSMQDSAIRTWLVDRSRTAKRDAARVMATLGGVRATYVLDGDHYDLVWNAPRSRWTNAEWAWWRKHGQEIVNTAAADYGPDVIGLLARRRELRRRGRPRRSAGGGPADPDRLLRPGGACRVEAGHRDPFGGHHADRPAGPRDPRDLPDRRAGLPAALIHD